MTLVLLALAITGWAVAFAVLIDASIHATRRLQRLDATEAALDTAVDQGKGLAALIAAARERVTEARRLVHAPGHDTSSAVQILNELTATGPLSDRALWAIVDQDNHVIPGETVEVA